MRSELKCRYSPNSGLMNYYCWIEFRESEISFRFEDFFSHKSFVLKYDEIATYNYRSNIFFGKTIEIVTEKSVHLVYSQKGDEIIKELESHQKKH